VALARHSKRGANSPCLCVYCNLEMYAMYKSRLFISGRFCYWVHSSALSKVGNFKFSARAPGFGTDKHTGFSI